MATTIPFAGSQKLNSHPWTSSSVVVPAGDTEIQMQMTSASPWDGATGQLSWEIQYLDANNTWQLLIGQSDTNGNPLPFGSRDRFGNLPSVAYANQNLPGLTIRCQAWATSSVTVGISGTLSAPT